MEEFRLTDPENQASIPAIDHVGVLPRVFAPQPRGSDCWRERSELPLLLHRFSSGRAKA